ncbi:hypothetical protein WJ968_04560 [Achromobacter xylosoxidans]
MLLQSLGYVGVETTRLDEWRVFGPRIMGLEVADATASSLAFRMDDRKQRILVDQGSADGAVFYGWEVADGDALERLAARLDRAGVRVEAMSRAARPAPGGARPVLPRSVGQPP